MSPASSSHHQPLSSLPVELLIDILCALDCPALLACRQVSKLFDALISQISSLQLVIELYAAGQEDGPKPTFGPAARLEALEKHQAAWDNFDWTKDQSIPMLGGGLWELYGGVLAQSTTDGAICLRRLASDCRSIPELEWTVGGFGFPVRDFSLDPSQDLLVLVEAPKWSGPNPDHNYRFHLRTLSSGGQHPLAFNPAVICHPQTTEDMQMTYTMQISEDHFGVLFNSLNDGENEFCIWEWKSGRREVDLTGDEIRSFSFFSGQCVVLALLNVSEQTLDLEPILLVLDFTKESDEIHDVTDVENGVSFPYPRLHPDAGPVKFEIRSDPAPAFIPDPSLHVPFFTARHNRLFIASLSVLFQGRLQCILLFAPFVTFRSCLDNLTAGQTVVDWNIWGPTGSRIIVPRRHPSDVWVCYVNGSKYAALQKKKNRIAVEVYDFNRWQLQRTSQKDREANPGVRYEMDKSVFEAGSVFEHQVETSLPYRLRTLPLDTRYTSNLAIMCSEDNLIIVDTHVDRREYRVLSF
ncbi:hypothetical protein Hypma_015693 [Hypsizygus marmoreus]|uniref:F-box domain-containing protein n=1 Tax=Hypsizygus marmoreus TaxID=39966 RepID=A0A369K807_HYPMA|nr:hypothetical protein Hypma_015693 [Hypsizygus marmoreus]